MHVQRNACSQGKSHRTVSQPHGPRSNAPLVRHTVAGDYYCMYRSNASTVNPADASAPSIFDGKNSTSTPRSQYWQAPLRLTTTAMCMFRPILREICLAIPLDWNQTFANCKTENGNGGKMGSGEHQGLEWGNHKTTRIMCMACTCHVNREQRSSFWRY